MRRKGFSFVLQNLDRHWSFGFELYRTPTQFSRGAGPEYGFYLHLGPWRCNVNYARPFSKAHLARLRAVAPVQRRS